MFRFWPIRTHALPRGGSKSDDGLTTDFALPAGLKSWFEKAETLKIDDGICKSSILEARLIGSRRDRSIGSRGGARASTAAVAFVGDLLDSNGGTPGMAGLAECAEALIFVRGKHGGGQPRLVRPATIIERHCTLALARPSAHS